MGRVTERAFSDLVTGDGVRRSAGVADLGGRRVAAADEVAADRVRHDLRRVEVAAVTDLNTRGVHRDDVALDRVADDAEPAALPAVHDDVPVDHVVLDREVEEGIEGRARSTADRDDVAVDGVTVEVHRHRLRGDDVSANGVVSRLPVARRPGTDRTGRATQPQNRPFLDENVAGDVHGAEAERVEAAARCEGQVAVDGQRRAAVDEVRCR